MAIENQKTPDEKLMFPMKFDKCPMCGSTKRVAEMLRDEEAAKGKVPKDSHMIAFRAVTPITELNTIILGLSIVPVLTFEFDVCANPKCGAFYPVVITRQDMPTSDLQKMMGIVPAGPQILNRQQRRHPN